MTVLLLHRMCVQGRGAVPQSGAGGRCQLGAGGAARAAGALRGRRGRDRADPEHDGGAQVRLRTALRMSYIFTATLQEEAGRR